MFFVALAVYAFDAGGATAVGAAVPGRQIAQQRNLALGPRGEIRVAALGRRRDESPGDPLDMMEQRLANDDGTEMRNALAQIGDIARGRLAKLLGEG